MGNKNEEFVVLKQDQAKLKKEIKKRKKHIPFSVFFLIIIIIAVLTFYDYNVSNFFGKHFETLTLILVLLVIIFASYVMKTYFKIRNINNEIKNINSKIYQLTKLEVDEK